MKNAIILATAICISPIMYVLTVEYIQFKHVENCIDGLRSKHFNYGSTAGPTAWVDKECAMAGINI